MTERKCRARIDGEQATRLPPSQSLHANFRGSQLRDLHRAVQMSRLHSAPDASRPCRWSTVGHFQTERDLSRRVEAIAPIKDPGLKERLWDILRVSLADCRQAWDMQPDGSYRKVPLANAKTPISTMGTQAYLMQKAKDSVVVS